MEKTIPLSALAQGDRCEVDHITADGPERRRMLDLGMIPGTKIEVLQRSPSGDPAAYEIRGTVIALRDQEAAQIQVKCLACSLRHRKGGTGGE